MQIKNLIIQEIKNHFKSKKSDAPIGSENFTQDENIKTYLDGMNMITPIYALNVFGSFRLSAIIHRLRQDGMDIVTEIVTIKGKSFACYMLKDRYEELQKEANP